MSSKENGRGLDRNGRLFHSWAAALVILCGTVLAGCATAEAPPAESENAVPTDAGEPVAATPVEPPAPATIADLFPDDPAKDLVLNNCAACHAVACNAIGQRTAGRWNSLQEDHRDKASSLSEEDLGAIFSYLAANFNESRPEPTVPPHFLEGGCTPF